MPTEQELVKHREGLPRTIPLITNKQYDRMIKLFKAGAVLDVVLSHFEMTQAEAFHKQNIYGGDYDKKFARAVALGTVHSKRYHFDTRHDNDPRVWMAVMKNEFGWSGGNIRNISSGGVSRLVFNPDCPEKTIDDILTAVANDEISVEKAKVMKEIVIDSYQVRQIKDV